jgi:hypothetical protein
MLDPTDEELDDKQEDDDGWGAVDLKIDGSKEEDLI